MIMKLFASVIYLSNFAAICLLAINIILVSFVQNIAPTWVALFGPAWSRLALYLVPSLKMAIFFIHRSAAKYYMEAPEFSDISHDRYSIWQRTLRLWSHSPDIGKAFIAMSCLIGLSELISFYTEWNYCQVLRLSQVYPHPLVYWNWTLIFFLGLVSALNIIFVYLAVWKPKISLRRIVAIALMIIGLAGIFSSGYYLVEKISMWFKLSTAPQFTPVIAPDGHHVKLAPPRGYVLSPRDNELMMNLVQSKASYRPLTGFDPVYRDGLHLAPILGMYVSSLKQYKILEKNLTLPYYQFSKLNEVAIIFKDLSDPRYNNVIRPPESLLEADKKSDIYDHPHYRYIVGCSGMSLVGRIDYSAPGFAVLAQRCMYPGQDNHPLFYAVKIYGEMVLNSERYVGIVMLSGVGALDRDKFEQAVEHSKIWFEDLVRENMATSL